MGDRIAEWLEHLPRQDLLIGLGALALLFLVFRWRGPRYIVDERGERQRVQHWSRGQPVYTPQTWQQRINEEATLRSKRRLAIVLSAPFVVGPGYVFYLAYTEGSFLLGAGAGVLLVYVAFPFALAWFLPNLVMELVYQTGYQGMQGAKVLDKAPPPQPGRELVETQRAHGDARLATEREARALLNSRR